MTRFRPALPPAVSGTVALLRLLPQVSLALTLLLAGSVLVLTALPLAFTVVTGLLVGSIPTALRHGLSSAAGSTTLRLLGLAAGIILVQRILGPVQGALATVFGRQVDRRLQERVMATVGHPPGVGHLEDPTILDAIKSSQTIGTTGLRPGDAVPALASLLPSWFQALGSAVILATFRPWLGLAWLVLWPILLYYLQREYLRLGSVSTGQSAAMRRAEYYRDLALTPGAGKEVRIWGLPDWLVTRFGGSWLDAMSPIWAARLQGRRTMKLTATVVTLADLGTFAFLAWAATHREISLGGLALYTRAAIDASTFRAADDQNTTLAYTTVTVPTLLALEAELSEPSSSATVSLPPPSPSEGIRFEHVGFRYPNATTDTLADIDLAIPATHSLAVVGDNGAGKTTVVKLLCRLYEPTAGRIVVDGRNLAEVAAEDWQGHVVATIFQDFTHYHLSARDNVALGAPHWADDIDRLREASRRAGVLELIEPLPHGWETILSRQYSGGVDLSGGEWQRIALARAFFAVEAGARVLILDEPTTNLDVRAEGEIYDRFLELTAGLTTILISHRFSTVRRAERIVVLDGGRILEQGSHEELLALNGRYAAMFRLQAEQFALQEAGTDG